MARRLFASLGHSDIPILVTPNPVIYLTPVQIDARVDALLDRIVSSFEPRAARTKR